MTEKFPEVAPGSRPPQPAPAVEQAPASYETSLETARALKAANIEDPFDPSPQSLAAQAHIRRYEEQENLSPDHVGSWEEAEKLCRLARIWLDAGYTADRFRGTALEVLGTIRATAIREHGEESQIVSDIDQHIYDVETGPGSPRALQEERGEQYVAAGLRDADVLAVAGKLAEAIKLLTTVNENEDTHELRVSVREELHRRLRQYKTKLETPNLKTELFARVEAPVRAYIESSYSLPAQAEQLRVYLKALENQDQAGLRKLHSDMQQVANRETERRTPTFKEFQYLIHYLGQWLRPE